MGERRHGADACRVTTSTTAVKRDAVPRPSAPAEKPRQSVRAAVPVMMHLFARRRGIPGMAYFAGSGSGRQLAAGFLPDAVRLP